MYNDYLVWIIAYKTIINIIYINYSKIKNCVKQWTDVPRISIEILISGHFEV